MEAAFNLNDGLDLPDWLKRAAAEQPYDPSQATHPAELSFASLTFEGQTSGTIPADYPSNGTARAEDRLPPRAIPNGDLSTSLPAWLQQPPETSAATEPRSAPAPAPPDLADTTSFISENDLPEWIRQLAAAEAAKKAEESRLAATTRTDEATGTSTGRRLLPGEMPPAEPVTQPWLARRERPEAIDAAMVETWSRLRPASPAATHARDGDAPVTTPVPVDETTSAPVASAPVQVIPEQGGRRLSTARIVLVIAAVLAVIAVIVALGFGV